MDNEELPLEVLGLPLDQMTEEERERYKDIVEKVPLYTDPSLLSAQPDYSRLTDDDRSFLRQLVDRLKRN